ncbi:hypothetical protein M422DRAFT_257547 [Sphaerobolus stellatus SS14]|uniref:Uncharacterized protein n=1 Tax=Sphaerobolus stellatus (strain SS14) TaxID=990650 RepID=A0A0C9VPD6_SPHS4|nr:hypothetical protein M422DRAFT_257547 [Sphaerobolus stellatus SS14]
MSVPPPPPPPANHWHAARYSSVMQTPARQSALPPLNHLYAPPHARYPSQGGYRSHETNTGSARTAGHGHAKSRRRRHRKSHRRKDRPKRTLCQLAPGARQCQAAWSNLREMRDTSRGVPHFPHLRARQSGSPTVRVFLAVPTKSLPCALARGDNDRDRIEKDY